MENSVSLEQYTAITLEKVFTRENKPFYAYLVTLYYNNNIKTPTPSNKAKDHSTFLI